MKTVCFTIAAQQQLQARRDWWRHHRDKAPDLFDQEFGRALERIRQSPESFPIYRERARHVVRRCLMPRTACHLYFETFAESDEVIVLVVGGSRRQRPPKMRFQEESALPASWSLGQVG